MVLIQPRQSNTKDIKMVLTASRRGICRRVAADYAADLSEPILDRGRNA